MPENLMNSAQKANSKEFSSNYDRIFGTQHDMDMYIDIMDFDCSSCGCRACPRGDECRAYLSKKYDLGLVLEGEVYSAE